MLYSFLCSPAFNIPPWSSVGGWVGGRVGVVSIAFACFFPASMQCQVPDIWWPQSSERGRKYDKHDLFLCDIWKKNEMSAQMLEIPLLGVGTVLRLERDAWYMVVNGQMTEATQQMSTPSPASPPSLSTSL